MRSVDPQSKHHSVEPSFSAVPKDEGHLHALAGGVANRLAAERIFQQGLDNQWKSIEDAPATHFALGGADC